MQASAQLFDLPLEQVKLMEETINSDSVAFIFRDQPHFFDLEGVA